MMLDTFGVHFAVYLSPATYVGRLRRPFLPGYLDDDEKGHFRRPF